MSGKKKGLGKSTKGKAQVRSKTPKVESIPSAPSAITPSVFSDISHAIDALISQARKSKTETNSASKENICGVSDCPLCDFISRRKHV